MIEIPCVSCSVKVHPTKEEAIGEKYLFCWYCGITFKNPNYMEKK